MKPLSSPVLLLVSMLGFVLKTNADHPGTKLELVEDAKSATLTNGQLRLIFDKKSAKLASLTSNGGPEFLASGGGYVQIAYTSRHDNPPISWDFRVIKRTPELIEIAFVNTHPDSPFDHSTHYVVRAGEPGFYNYLTWGHDASRSPGVFRMAQYNFALRVQPSLFTTAVADDQRIAKTPKTELLTKEHMVMDATYKLPGGGYYSKYFFASERDEKHPVHGLMTEATASGAQGLWIIMPSQEHLNGGPEHQELTVHADGSQVLLAHAQGAHYGAGILTTDSKDGSWQKTSAPWFIYVNSAPSQAALWQDAKLRAAKEVQAWPYGWLDDSLFQLKRATLAGNLSFGNGKPVAGARIILAQHEEKPGPLAWQQQCQGYRYSGWADVNGRFELSKLRSGIYDLYAWQPGSFGNFLQSRIEVGVGEKKNLGELKWNQPQARELLWQIGKPDRSGAEFGFAENFRQWGLWQQIAKATPNGVTYVAGKSRDRDWPFQMAVTRKPDSSWQAPAWRVQFNSIAGRSGQALITLGIAAYEGRQKPQLNLSLNGELIGSVGDLEMSGAAHRSGIHAGYQQREIAFDAGKIKAGNNVLSIEIPAPPPLRGSVRKIAASAPKDSGDEDYNLQTSLIWDSLRLEALK